MSGPDKLLKSKDRLKEFESILDNFLSTVGLNRTMFQLDSPSTYTHPSEDELRQLTEGECSIWAFKLVQYAAYIQQELNRNSSRKKWAEGELGLILANHWKDFSSDGDDKWLKYDVVRSKIVNGNSAAQALYEIIKHAECRVTELTGVSDRLCELATILRNFAFSKRKRQE